MVRNGKRCGIRLGHLFHSAIVYLVFVGFHREQFEEHKIMEHCVEITGHSNVYD